MQTTNPGLIHEMENWCERKVNANNTNTTLTENTKGNKEIECKIQTNTYDIHLSIDENKNGKVLFNDKTRDNRERLGYTQDWEGDVENIDLHHNGITMAGHNASFSLNWQDP